MDSSGSLKKSCSICGQPKPLTSFLQLGGPEGTFYGTVCADCRRAGLDKKKELDNEDTTTRRSTETIKSEQRLHAELTKKLEHSAEEEEYKEEREKKEALQSKKQLKAKSIASKEKQHREGFLKKHTFLDTNKTLDKQKAAETKQKVDLRQKVESTKAEEKLKTIDLTGPYTPSQTGGQIKLQGTVFNQFKDWLGTGEGAYLNKNLNAPGSTANKAKEHKTKVDKAQLENHIKKTWRPK